ncbi:7807_t:CDS:2, partial [Scutellospora calospora]
PSSSTAPTPARASAAQPHEQARTPPRVAPHSEQVTRRSRRPTLRPGRLLHKRSDAADPSHARSDQPQPRVGAGYDATGIIGTDLDGA